MRNDNLCTIYVVRHGETDWNTKKWLQGHTDIPLNENGEIQASQLGEQLKSIDFAVAFSSDLQRAKRTAEIIVLEKNLAVQTTKALRERTYGQFEGKPASEVRVALDELYSKLKEEEKAAYKPFPDMESDDELISRILTYLREIAVAYPGKNILVVSHGGVLRHLVVHLNSEHRDTKYHIENTAFIKLESDGVDFFVKETQGVTVKS